MNAKEINTENFKKAYLHLKESSDMKFSTQIYHHDDASEPFLSYESYADKVVLDYVCYHGLVITIITEETILSFNEKNWLVHVDKDYVSFGSANDNKTHCIIEFC